MKKPFHVLLHQKHSKEDIFHPRRIIDISRNLQLLVKVGRNIEADGKKRIRDLKMEISGIYGYKRGLKTYTNYYNDNTPKKTTTATKKTM